MIVAVVTAAAVFFALLGAKVVECAHVCTNAQDVNSVFAPMTDAGVLQSDFCSAT